MTWAFQRVKKAHNPGSNPGRCILAYAVPTASQHSGYRYDLNAFYLVDCRQGRFDSFSSALFVLNDDGDQQRFKPKRYRLHFAAVDASVLGDLGFNSSA